MRSRKYLLLISGLLILISLFLFKAGGVLPSQAHPFTEQKTFTLDLNQKTFQFEQRQLNETGYPYYKTFIYSAEQNKTFWIELPRNSTILNSSLKLTGLVLVNKTNIGANLELEEVSIGEVTSDPGNEIAISLLESATDNIRLYNKEKNSLWENKSGTAVYDVEIKNFTTDTRDEVIISSTKGIVVFNSNGRKVLENSLGTVWGFSVGNISGDSGDEIVGGGTNLYLLNSSLDLKENESSITTGDIKGVDIGNVVNSTSVNEMAIGTSGSETKVYLINYSNSSFNTIWSFTTEDNVNDLDIGNISGDSGNEIVAVVGSGTSNKVYALNSTGNSLWNYTLNDYGQSVMIGEVVNSSMGNEVVVGSGGSGIENKIHILNSTGELILSHESDGYVKGVDIGNISADSGDNINEILAVTPNGSLYELNYDAFPTNLSLDVADDGSIDWNYTGKFRVSSTIDDSNSNISNAIQTYLNENCTSPICEVPSVAFLLSSTYKGRLNVSNINITYEYNASSNIRNQSVSAWSKTQNIRVNQSIVSEAINISYSQPALNISIKYIRINDSATLCGFKNMEYPNVTIEGKNYCNVTDYNLSITPSTNTYTLLWDNQMNHSIPIYKNQTAGYNTSQTDNFKWMRNITIWSVADEIFTDITANTTLDDSVVKDNVFLNVTWDGTEYNITPNTNCPSMDSSLPLGFKACKDDSNGNGIVDFFNWTQPNISALSSVSYQAGGSRNLYPNLSSPSVNPDSDLWGKNFNFSIFVNDSETDRINVSLWLYRNFTNQWIEKDRKNISGSGNVSFNLTLDKNWVGSNSYKFEYFDYNTSEYKIHSSKNTSRFSGPEVKRHNVTINEVAGNNTNVNRKYGKTTTLLKVFINDSTGVSNWTDMSCSFRITKNSSDFDLGHSERINESGYCNYTFNPDSTYYVGIQIWNVSLNNSYYRVKNATNWTLRVKGHLNISLSQPQMNESLKRNNSIAFSAQLVDEYGSSVTSNSINTSNYNCKWYFNNTYLNTTSINSAGVCTNTWTPNCSYQTLGDYITNVTLVGGNATNYTLLDNESHNLVTLIDNISIGINSPLTDSSFYKGNSILLNSTVNDTCETCDLNPYKVKWYINWKDKVLVNLNETEGVNRTNEPIIIRGEELEQVGANLTTWKINSTRIIHNGKDVSIQILNASEYLNTNTSITFLANLTAHQNDSYLILHNESDVFTNYSIVYIENGGFESGETSGWSCQECSGGTYCNCSVLREGGEENGNYSVYLSSDNSGTNGISSIIQNLNGEVSSEYIKIRFKAWGEYRENSSTPYLKLKASSGVCDLTPPSGSQILEEDANWNTTLCQNSSFSSANSVNISIYDDGSGGAESDASHVYVDYICIADSSGTCKTFDSGLSLKNLKARENISSNLENSTNSTWTIPLTHKVGPYTVFANVSGDYYSSDEDKSYIEIYGLSNISEISINSIVEGECHGNNCYTGVDLNLTCTILDANTSTGIYNYTVKFYDNNSYINSTRTNKNGIASYTWVNSTNQTGNHIIKCNISNAPSLYYNITQNNFMNQTIAFESTTTNATLNVTPKYKEAVNLTKTNSNTLNFTVNVSNVGGGYMYGISIIVYNQTGINGIPYEICSSLNTSSSCLGNVSFTVSRNSGLGNNSINMSLEWSNPWDTSWYENKTVVINATNTTVVNINKTEIYKAMPYGGSKHDTFLLEAFGNTKLENVTFNLVNGNVSLIEDWILLNSSLVNETFFNVSRLGNKTVQLSISVPNNDTYLGKNYWTYLVGEESNLSCSGYSDCNDTLLINISVTQQHWKVTPLEESKKVVGKYTRNTGSFELINITNLQNYNLTLNITKKVTNGTHQVGSRFFNITLIQGNTTTLLPSSPFNITNLSSAFLNISYDVSDVNLTNETGNYYVNLSIHNLNPSSVPQWINISRSLEISSFEINIVSPTQSSPSDLVNASDSIVIHTNATYGEAQTLSENVSWKIWVGGVSCPITKNESVSNQNYIWNITCSAPVIPGNPINNTLLVAGNYTTYNLEFNDSETDAIRYNDRMSPRIWSVEIIPGNYSSPTAQDGDLNLHYTLENTTNITVKVNITDNKGISSAWVNFTLSPSGALNDSNLKKDLVQTNNGYWQVNYTKLGSNWKIGDYKVDVYVNDTDDQHHNNTENLTLGYFDVYRPLQFYSSFNNSDGEPINVTLSFYKPDTNWILHQNTTNDFNLSVHKRNYDIKAKVFNHEITFKSANLTLSALNQYNDSSPGNLTNPIKFDYFPNKSAKDISNIQLPDTAENRLLAIVVEPANLSFSNANFSLNYTQALKAGSYTEEDLEVLMCSNWDYNSRTCDDGEFKYLAGTGNLDSSNPDVSSNLFTFTSTPSSAYALAESCYPNICGQAPKTTETTTSGGGGGGGVSETTTTIKEEEFPFTVDTNLGTVRIHPGEKKEYWISITNQLSREITPTLSISEDIQDYLTLSTTQLKLKANSTGEIDATVSIPKATEPGVYSGKIKIEENGNKKEVPVTLRVTRRGEAILSLEVDIIKRKLKANEDLKFQVKLRNFGKIEKLNPTLTYLIENGKNEKVVKKEKENITVEELKTYTKIMSLNETGLPVGEHYLKVWARFDGKSVSDMEVFEIVKPFFATTIGQILLWVALIMAIIVGSIFIRKYYLSWKKAKKAKTRYLFPVDYGKIPQKTPKSFLLGKIADTDKKAWYNPKDLMTHVLVAGATGAGKSVAASIFVEEALEQNIPVIVFDPTAQFTGFMKRCKDDDVLRYYPKFGMDKRRAKSYPGLVEEIESADIEIDFKKYMKSGEVTVFTLNKIDPENFDKAVTNIIDSMFEVDWEESTELKMIVVFDEVHRLLEKYGGKGGYKALERACREFRKWGIGLVMCSQVLADFKEAVAGNVLTDVQLNTKSMTDIGKVREKYGEEYARRVTKQGVGVGMLQHPKYNKGKPYFVNFRPPYHNPHKITEEEMEQYKEFSELLEKIRKKIDEMEEKGMDVFDLKTEFRLANNKLKQGKFRMTKLYIRTLKKRLNMGD